MADSLHPGLLASILGSAAMTRGTNSSWELAVVVSYNTQSHTATVKTHRGRPLRDVPQVKFSTNQYDMLATGTTVIVTEDLGFPVILGSLEMATPSQTVIDAPSITGIEDVGAAGLLNPGPSVTNYRPQTAPSDLGQGDWAHMGALGQHVAVLEGGIASLGSPSALVQSLGLLGVLQLIARNMFTSTDFGTWKTENNQGETSFILRAGASQATQTGAGEENWTIRLDVGATGDLFNFRITEPQGKDLFKLHVGPDGKVTLYGDAGIDISSGPKGDSETQQSVAGARVTNIGQSDTLTVDGDHAQSIGKAYSQNINTDRTVAVGNNDSVFVNKDQTHSVGGKKTEVIAGGDSKTAKKGDTAYTTKVLNGGWKIDIGDPAAGASVSAQAAFDVKTSLGDITLDAGGGMKLKAKQIVEIDGQLIKLGGETYSVAKWDDFLRDFGQFLTLLLAGLQAGTVGSPVKQQLLVLMGTIGQLQQFAGKVNAGQVYKSTKVKNG